MEFIIILGSSVHFSNSFVSALSNKFSDLTVVRNPDAGTLDGSVRAVVLGPGDLARMPKAIEDVEARHPNAAILKCVNRDDDLYPVFKCLRDTNRHSTISLVPLNFCLDGWLSIISLALMGQNYIPVSACLGADRPAPPRNGLLKKLTSRESEVLALAADGAQNKAIAHSLDLSEHTVKLHMHHIIKKLGVANRTQAAQRFRHVQ